MSNITFLMIDCFIVAVLKYQHGNDHHTYHN